MAFENKVAKQIAARWPDAEQGAWFEFQDTHGRGYCQVDHLVLFDHCVLVFETKLTEGSADMELLSLYRPVTELAYGRPTILCSPCKVLRRQPKFEVTDLSYLPTLASGPIWLWHYLG